MIPYQKALDRQLKYVDEVADGTRPETVIFCTHPPVVTLGRATEPGDITDWQGELIEVSRGGRATYHGPDQMVVYPILNLSNRGRDLHKHLRLLEDVVREVMNAYGIVGTIEPGATGVWVGSRKVCSIGIAVKKWVSYHGLSLAVDADPNAYKGINPCGYSAEVMVSLEQLVGRRVQRAEIVQQTREIFDRVLSGN